MEDANPIRTLGDYSKPSHEGYRNTIELPVGNNVVPLRSDTIRLVQNGCSFYGLRSEDLNQHLKDFLKLVYSVDIDSENRERMRLRLFQFSIHDQASNWLECLPIGSITTWEDLTTRFLAQFFPLRSGKLRDRNAEDSWALFEDLALYDNESWNDPRDFAKPVNAIFLSQDLSSTSDRHLIELENQVQCLIEAHRAPTQPTHVNKITSTCEICSGPRDTQYYMENPEQAFVENVSSRTYEAGVSFARSYPTIDPQCSSHPSTSINAVKTCSKEASHSQTRLVQTGMGIETQQTEETKPTLEDEFQDLHLNLPVLEVLAHAPIYNTMLDKYLESLELGKKRISIHPRRSICKDRRPRVIYLISR
uniref:MAK10-like protein n=1 Tax=Tanacetum cinerariifolium TaxID=118510 RepID=A0A6L2MJA7_TANCI|nr:MAK10-like protein [Tanacetum cinerariifolium]